MDAILIHGMGRTPLSMLLLAVRLKLAGIRPRLFRYCAATESWRGCTHRLQEFIQKSEQPDYMIVGHSLGGVLARAMVPRLDPPPKAVFLIAPPSTACMAARRFSSARIFKALTGEMGQRLASQHFMSSLPAPSVPTTVFAGTGGFTGRFSLFGSEANDGILALHETRIPGTRTYKIPSLHTFIMNSRAVAQAIICAAAQVTKVHA